MKFHIIRHLTLTGWQWRWRLLAGNNRTIAISGESYRNRADAEAIVVDIKKNVPYATRERVS